MSQARSERAQMAARDPGFTARVCKLKKKIELHWRSMRRCWLQVCAARVGTVLWPAFR